MARDTEVRVGSLGPLRLQVALQLPRLMIPAVHEEV